MSMTFGVRDRLQGDRFDQKEHTHASNASEHSMTERNPRDVLDELARRLDANDMTVLDDVVAADMVNHAAGPQGRAGIRLILQTIEHDLGPVSFDQHHLIADDDLVVQHVTVHGTHRASTMPLLAGVSVSGRPATWTFIHIWKVVEGMIVEHWACRDDMGLLEQLEATR
jgi:predicted ester cyclase